MRLKVLFVFYLLLFPLMYCSEGKIIPWGDYLLKHLGGECPPAVPHFTTITDQTEALK